VAFEEFQVWMEGKDKSEE